MHKLLSVFLCAALTAALPTAAFAQDAQNTGSAVTPTPAIQAQPAQTSQVQILGDEPEGKIKTVKDTINPLGPLLYFIGVSSTIIGGTLGAFSIKDYSTYLELVDQGAPEADQAIAYDDYQERGIMSLSFMGAGLLMIIFGGLFTSPFDSVPIQPDGSYTVAEGLGLNLSPTYLGFTLRPGR